MKNGNYTTKINWIATMIIAVLILLSGCKKQHLLEPTDANLAQKPIIGSTVDPQNSLSNVSFSSEKIVDLMAGEHLFKIGTVVIKNHSSGLMEVTYTLISPWKINSARLFIGDPSQIPVNSSGEAIPAQFPYKQNLSVGGSGSLTFLIQKSLINGCRSVAAQGIVYDSETLSTPQTAWANGTQISINDSGMYYSYCINDYRPDVAIE